MRHDRKAAPAIRVPDARSLAELASTAGHRPGVPAIPDLRRQTLRGLTGQLNQRLADASDLFRRHRQVTVPP